MHIHAGHTFAWLPRNSSNHMQRGEVSPLTPTVATWVQL